MRRAAASCLGPCIAAALLCAPTPARAHEAPETSAAVTLRDHGVEVWIDVETLRWLDAVAPADLRLSLHDPTRATPDTLERAVAEATSSLAATFLEVDGRRVVLEVVRGIAVGDVMASVVAGAQGGHHRVRLSLRGEVPSLRSGAAVSAGLRLAQGFGPVIMSLARPETTWVAPGDRGQLRLDAPVAAPRVESAPPSPPRPASASLLGVAAIAGAVGAGLAGALGALRRRG